MTNQPKTFGPTQATLRLHLFARERYSFEPDYNEQPWSYFATLTEDLNSEPALKHLGERSLYLYSKNLTLPVPEFDPVAKQLVAIENREAGLRERYHQELLSIKKEKDRLLALTHQTEEPNQ